MSGHDRFDNLKMVLGIYTSLLYEQPISTTKDVMSIYPVIFERRGQLADERLGRFVREKGSTRANDHALFAAGQHDVCAALVYKKPGSV